MIVKTCKIASIKCYEPKIEYNGAYNVSNSKTKYLKMPGCFQTIANSIWTKAGLI